MVEGMGETVVTVSGYCGIERMMLIKLISFAGANYVGRLSRSTTHLICWKFKGKKFKLAKKFGTLIINHQWLEDCNKEGKCIPEFPYTMQSGQEIGFNIHSLPVVRETADILSENELLLNRLDTHDCLNDVIDLVSNADEIENDDWDDDLLRDENVLPIPGSRKAARQMSKRLDKETLRGDRRTKADARKANREPQKPTVDRVQCEVSDYSLRCSIKQKRSENDTSILPFAESSHRCRRLVKKFDKRNFPEIATIDAEQQSITRADVNELTVASSLSDDPNDLSMEIGASSSRRSHSPWSVAIVLAELLKKIFCTVIHAAVAAYIITALILHCFLGIAVAAEIVGCPFIAECFMCVLLTLCNSPWRCVLWYFVLKINS